MKPQARIQSLIDLRERIDQSRIPMDSTCGDYFRVRRYIGSKDRAYLAETIYEMMRHKARLQWWLQENLGLEYSARRFVLLFLRLVQAMEMKRLKDLCDGSKYAPDPLDEDELEWLAKLEGQDLHPGDMPGHVRVECPTLYEDALRNYFGNDFEVEMQAMLNPATLDLRVNTYRASREKVQAFLEADGIKTEMTPYSPWGLRCENKAYLSRTKAMGKGWIEIQDEGSQLISWLCAARPGMQVLDYCAGAGGKTLGLAAAMECKGRIVAMDNDERRLNKGRQRYKKAGISDIIEVRCIDDEKNRKWIKRQKEKFDLVLLDVPCSGTGTWRRNPDMRWSVYGPPLDELTAIQADILEKTCALVKPGGRLVYATCSLLPDENEAQVENFLTAHPEFEVQAVDGEMGIGSPYMRLTPHRTNTDGFFAAILLKK